MTVIATAILAVADKQNPLIPPVFDIVWSAVVLIVVALVLGKFALPKFNALTDERRATVERGIADAEEAKQDKELAKTRSAKIIDDSRKEAQVIRENASAEGRRIIERAKQEAKEEADRIYEQAMRTIEAQEQAANLSLRSDVGLLAAELAEKIVGEQLKDRELSARVIDRFLDDLEVATKEN